MLFVFDSISGFFLSLLVIVGLPAWSYARKQLQATQPQSQNLLYQIGLTLLLLGLLACSNNPGLFLLCWAPLPFLMSRLIAAFPSKASAYSARLAFISLTTGTVLLGIGCLLQFELWQPWPLVVPKTNHAALCCLIAACLIQSGLFPAHRWLLNSLCAPTAVSALMHAGFINASGLLLLRIGPLLQTSPLSLLLLAVAGGVSIVIGLLTSAVQADQKRALACSTIAQMGCLFLYSALNLPSLLAAHLLAHAMYKSYAFLGMGLTLQEGLVSDNPYKKIMGIVSAVVFVGLGMMDSLIASHPIVLLCAALLGYQIGTAPTPPIFSILNIALFAGILSVWHTFFEILITEAPSSSVGPLVEWGAGAVLLMVPLFSQLPVRYQRPCYAFFLRLARPDREATCLKRGWV